MSEKFVFTVNQKYLVNLRHIRSFRIDRFGAETSWRIRLYDGDLEYTYNCYVSENDAKRALWKLAKEVNNVPE